MIPQPLTSLHYRYYFRLEYTGVSWKNVTPLPCAYIKKFQHRLHRSSLFRRRKILCHNLVARRWSFNLSLLKSPHSYETRILCDVVHLRTPRVHGVLRLGCSTAVGLRFSSCVYPENHSRPKTSFVYNGLLGVEAYTDLLITPSSLFSLQFNLKFRITSRHFVLEKKTNLCSFSRGRWNSGTCNCFGGK